MRGRRRVPFERSSGEEDKKGGPRRGISIDLKERGEKGERESRMDQEFVPSCTSFHFVVSRDCRARERKGV